MGNRTLTLTRENAAGSDLRAITSKAMFNGTKAFGKGWTKDTDFQNDINEVEAPTSMTPDMKKNYYYYLWQINEPASGAHNIQTKWRVNIKYIVKFFDRKAFSSS